MYLIFFIILFSIGSIFFIYFLYNVVKKYIDDYKYELNREKEWQTQKLNYDVEKILSTDIKSL